MAILDVLMRYVHIMSAVLAVGGAFFLLVLLPGGLRLIDDPARRDEVLLKVRRAYKLTVHPAILGLLVSGAYNSYRLWPAYKLNMARHHAFWGPHLLLGLTAMGISLWLLAGRSLRPNHRTWLKANVGLLFVVIFLASTLRWVRLDTARERTEALQRLAEQIDPMAKRVEAMERTLGGLNERVTGAPVTPPTPAAPATQPASLP